eukprot:3736841-Pyramimonas_sp.AAC.1
MGATKRASNVPELTRGPHAQTPPRGFLWSSLRGHEMCEGCAESEAGTCRIAPSGAAYGR